MEEKELKYQYHVKVWGGFFNEEYKEIHKQEPGDYVFDTIEERNLFIQNLKVIETNLDAKHLAISITEGFDCVTRTVLHRVCEMNGKFYKTEYDMGINYPYSSAQYHLDYKWYPGFNDYPFGDNFNYQRKDWKVVSEWITGSFKQDFQ